MRLTTANKRTTIQAMCFKAGFESAAKAVVEDVKRDVDVLWKDHREANWLEFEMALKKTPMIIRRSLPHMGSVSVVCRNSEDAAAAIWAGMVRRYSHLSSNTLRVDVNVVAVPSTAVVEFPFPEKRMALLRDLYGRAAEFEAAVTAIVMPCKTKAALVAALPGAEAFLPAPEKPAQLPAVVLSDAVKENLLSIGVKP